MPNLIAFLSTLAVFFLLLAALYLYVRFRATVLPHNRPGRVDATTARAAGKVVVVCAGDSITHGAIGSNYPKELAKRLGPGFMVVNAGVNGDLAYNLHQRVDDILACQPDIIIVLIGTNDAMAALDPIEAQAQMRDKKLPRPSDADWFRSNLEALVNALQENKNTSLALLTLPTIDEQTEGDFVRITQNYSRIIEGCAQAAGVTCLPLHTRMLAALPPKSTSEAADITRFRARMNAAILKRYLLGQSWARISGGYGYCFHIDPLHLNDDGANMVVDLVEEFILKTRSER